VQELTDQNAVLEMSATPRQADTSALVRAPVLVRLGRTIPAVLVFTALGGLFAWGHYSGWAVPRFSALTGAAPDDKDDWCRAHSIPESQCVECNPALMPKPKEYGWCKKHGVHECVLEHPDVAQTPTRAQVSTAHLDRAERALALAERAENNSKCKAHLRRLQFASAAAVEKAGIEVEPVWEAPIAEFVSANGEIGYDQTHTARLSARVPGTVFRAFKQVGDRVRAGEVVALVDAADVGRAKSELLSALASFRLKRGILARMQSTAAKGALPERTVLEAETVFSEARIRFLSAQQAMNNLGLPVQIESLDDVPDDQLADRLRFLGLPENVAESFTNATTGNLLPLIAPFDGVVVARDVVPGEVVDTHKILFVVVDTARVWLTLDVRLEDARFIRLNQQVRFRPDGGKEEAVGSITWISTEADHKTRTLKVRAVLDNAEGRLRANTFGSGKIVLREENKAVVVPNGAVHWEGDCHVVFIRDKDFLKPGAPKVFHIRTVRLGAREDKQTEIIAGVLPGELVASKGSAALRAELLRGNLGEG
jgi:cobalt-zinc-cadmium efflux system membrane fusion protein